MNSDEQSDELSAGDAREYHSPPDTRHAEEPRKWSWVEFILGFLNKKLLVFTVSTVIVFLLLFKVVEDPDTVFRWIMGGGWLLLGIIFMLSASIEKSVEKAKINLELKAGAQTNINAEVSKMIEAARSIAKGEKNENSQ